MMFGLFKRKRRKGKSAEGFQDAHAFAFKMHKIKKSFQKQRVGTYLKIRQDRKRK